MESTSRIREGRSERLSFFEKMAMIEPRVDVPAQRALLTYGADSLQLPTSPPPHSDTDKVPGEGASSGASVEVRS